MKTLVQWLGLGALVGVLCGAGSALFLWLLDEATTFRTAHERLIYALPLAGLVLGWVYERYGRAIARGSNLIIDTIHDDGPELPLRMAPMVLVGTVLTHLFGGSAGREGTAVQMGASLTDWLSHRLKLAAPLRRQLLAAGVAGGFGSVFGTPIAGAVFGLEFVVLGRLEYQALLPALVAALVGRPDDACLGHRAHGLPSAGGSAPDAAGAGEVGGVRAGRGRGHDRVHRADAPAETAARAAGATPAGAHVPGRRDGGAAVGAVRYH
jgi:hypothetical protein